VLDPTNFSTNSSVTPEDFDPDGPHPITPGPSATDVLIGTGDGSEDTFQLRKLFKPGTYQVAKNILRPINGTVLVSVDGVTKTETTHYTVNYNTGVVTFTGGNEPGAGLLVKAGCEFYTQARFAEELDAVFEISADFFDAGTVPSIPLVEDIDGGAIREDFIFLGGVNDGTVGVDVTLTGTTDRTRLITPSGAGINVIVDDPTTLVRGGPQYVVNNGSGSNTLTVKYGATTVGTIGTSETGWLHVVLDGGTQKWALFTA
jgi:hypothetical protein